MAAIHHESPIRVGVFESANAALRAINALLQAGFQRREITVVCNENAAEPAPELKAYIRERPAGPRSAGRMLTGAGVLYGVLAVVGIGAAALAAVFIGIITAFIVLGVALGIALLSVFGSIMVARGSERELSNFYAQGIEPGQLLVAVDLDEHAPPQRVAAADQVLQQGAAATISLPHDL
jgi:hypothetical protein